MKWSNEEREVFNSCFIEGKYDEEATYFRYIFKNGQGWQIVKTPKDTIQDIERYIEDMVLGAEAIGYRGTPSKNTKDIKPESISRRDYFAAMAMQGLAPQIGMRHDLQNQYHIAESAIALADALIKALDDKEK